MNELWAVIPSCCRGEPLGKLVSQLQDEGVSVVVIDTGYDPPLEPLGGVTVIRDVEQPKNISRWWNTGISYVSKLFHDTSTRHAIAILNDDVVLQPNTVRVLAEEMWAVGSTIAYPDQHGKGHNLLNTEARQIDLRDRIVGYAFVIDGHSDIYADERLEWWFGDDDIDWKARKRNGSLLVGGVTVQHLSPNGWQVTNPELVERAWQDRVEFARKWGMTPW